MNKGFIYKSLHNSLSVDILLDHQLKRPEVENQYKKCNSMDQDNMNS